MIGEKITCEREGCDVAFTKRTHNQIYHDAECTRLATNVKIMQKYYEGRARKLGHVRYCDTCVETRLSRYNPESTCNACSQTKETDRNKAVNDMLASVSWA